MKQVRRIYRDIEELKSEFAKRKDAIRRRLNEFASVQQEEYFFELVYCLLTPQSSAVNAAKAVIALRSAGWPQRECDIASLLHQDSFYIRFHHTKAKRIHEAHVQAPQVIHQVCNGSSSTELREWLVQNVKGLGWKEASHFLRNIGHRNLAILDRHILRNLKRHGLLRTLPRTLTAKRYLAIEQRFRLFADAVSISMDELDLLFWSRETGEILK